MNGTVKWYNERKGFGFISNDDGKDVFVHRTAIPAEAGLHEGDQVEYDIEDSDRGQRAINIKKLKST
jgi:CspA family cold shock protein